MDTVPERMQKKKKEGRKEGKAKKKMVSCGDVITRERERKREGTTAVRANLCRRSAAGPSLFGDARSGFLPASRFVSSHPRPPSRLVFSRLVFFSSRLARSGGWR